MSCIAFVVSIYRVYIMFKFLGKSFYKLNVLLHYQDGLKIPNLILPAYERAVSNCPWAVDLWICFAKALERLNQPHETIKGKSTHMHR